MLYDIIGDIHGHYNELHQLLLKMGYAYDEDGHCFSHPTRKALFVGDFIDRGRENLKSVFLVRNMVARGAAKAIMGNHDFSAVQFATPKPGRPGEFLRPHSDKNMQQQRTFLDEVKDDPHSHAEVVDWFKTLPIFFKDGDLHVVHACWHAAAFETLRRNGSIAPGGIITPQGWLHSSDVTHPSFKHFETVLKGPEEDICGNLTFTDPDGALRGRARTKWWVENPATYDEAYNLTQGTSFRERPFPPSAAQGGIKAKIQRDVKQLGMLFFGHYWMFGTPVALMPNVACVDYGLGAKDGKLVAYRMQEGETEINNAHFVSVPRLG